MSKKCPWCKVDVYLTELKHWYKCPECQTEFPERAFPKEITLFDRITASPEVLAPHLVYHDEEYEIAFSVVIRGKEQKMGHECWRSTIIPGDCWAEYDRAYAATVARLKEIEK